MKTSRIFLTLAAALAAVLLTAPTASAQRPFKKIEIKKLDTIVQTSPDYSADFVVEKRISRNKKWLEFEVEFQAEPLAGVANPPLFADDLLFKYFVVFKHKDPTNGKNVMTTGQVIHVNVELGESTHSAMYVSPPSTTRIRGSSGEASKTEIEGFAVQIFYAGELVAEEADYAKSTRWWATGVLPPKEGFLLPKADTPFAPLWYDYFAEVKTER